MATQPGVSAEEVPSTRNRTDAGNAGIDLRLDGLTKQFSRIGGEKVRAIDAMDLHVRSGEFLVLVGPSGCGKTTLLRCVAGLESPDEGRIHFGETTVYDSTRRTDLAPERRDAAMLFQSYALWPHMTVFENVAYPLKARRIPADEIRARVQAILDKVQCGNLPDQYPGQISGGQQQRVALARALVAGTGVVLFDEPLSNIDAKVRDQLRWEIQRVQREIGFTALYVTHDQIEALTLADRIAVLKEGRIAQLGSPREVYNQPASAYVARFMGALNELHGTPGPQPNVFQTDIGLLQLGTTPPGASREAGDCLLGFRPSACSLHVHPNEAPAQINLFQVRILAEVFLGTHHEYIVGSGPLEFRCWSLPRLGRQPGEAAWLHVPPAAVHPLVQ